MRVISGSARGLKLKAPAGLNTRPTVDRIKESLFNILSNMNLYDIEFLDLFSGTGGIGIEALSRGARSAVFVDNSNESIKVIKENLEHAHFSEKAEVLKTDVLRAISEMKSKNKKFDIIFMDPPYNKGLIQKTLSVIYDNNILKKDGIIVCEQGIHDDLPEVIGLEVYRIKEYKITKMTFIKYKED